MPIRGPGVAYKRWVAEFRVGGGEVRGEGLRRKACGPPQLCSQALTLRTLLRNLLTTCAPSLLGMGAPQVTSTLLFRGNSSGLRAVHVPVNECQTKEDVTSLNNLVVELHFLPEPEMAVPCMVHLGMLSCLRLPDLHLLSVGSLRAPALRCLVTISVTRADAICPVCVGAGLHSSGCH